MGLRGAGAAFMPDKYVFPGGAVDRADGLVPLAMPIGEACRARLMKENDHLAPDALAAAAIRELWEETGLCLGARGNWPDAPADWSGFAARGLLPDASALRFFFRAITPPGRPRRFDARFFLADASALATDPDDFSDAADELSHLHWVALDDVRRLSLPYITRIVLAELAQHLPRTDAPDGVPFIRNDQIDSHAIWL
jgi:8-oxo-dGTP pyrophosphatase MutT (NUDIX family)